MRAAAALFGAAFLAIAGSAKAEGLKLLPVDEAGQVPAFQAFRDGLLQAVRQRDLEAVLAAASEDIKLSFGGSYGRAIFRDWLIENDVYFGVSYWQELEQALALGGVFEGEDRFCTPYAACYAPEQCPACDPFDTLIVVSDRAPVYARPVADAEIVTYLSYDVLTMTEDQYPWFKVALPGGGTGFVTGPDFRSPVGYRAFLERRDGAWRMTVFIAGD